jgi:hypothetical protein
MRRTFKRQLLSSSLAGLLAAGLSVPAMALQQGRTGEDQQRSGQDQRSQAGQRGQQQDRSQQYGTQQGQQYGTQQGQQYGGQQQYGQQQTGQERFQQQYQQGGQQGRDGRQAGLQPQGWIRIAVDSNNDGQFDTVENIFMFDLQEAQQRSRQRQQQDQQRFGQQQDQQRFGQQDRFAQDDSRRRGQDQQRGMARQEGQTQQIQGTVEELRTTWVPDREGRFIVARVRTNEGRTEQVLLGSRNELRRLDLDRGDRVSISGSRGNVNNETMVIARQVESDGVTVRPQVEEDAYSQREQQRYTQRDQQDRFQTGQDSATQRFYQQDRDQRQDQNRVAQRLQQDRDQQQDRTQRFQQDRDQQDRDRGTQQRFQQDREQQTRAAQRAQQDRSRQQRQDGSSREIRGEVVSTQTMRVQGEDELQLVGNVRLQSGEQLRVHFGPNSKFEDVDLEAGTAVKVKVKARQGEVGGTQAWIAEEVELEDEDETIEVDI